MDLFMKTKALHKLRPNTEWRLDEENGLQFFDKEVQIPTDEEIESAAAIVLEEEAEKTKQLQDKKRVLCEQWGLTEEEFNLLLK
jgi:hypothetical protein